MGNEPLFTNDTIVFGLLMMVLGFIFYTSSLEKGFWLKFYKIVPALFMAYMLPAVLTTMGLIAPEWEVVNEQGEPVAETNLTFGELEVSSDESGRFSFDEITRKNGYLIVEKPGYPQSFAFSGSCQMQYPP